MCLLLEPRSDPSTGDDPKGSGTSEKNPVRLLTLCDDCRCQKKKKEKRGGPVLTWLIKPSPAYHRRDGRHLHSLISDGRQVETRTPRQMAVASAPFPSFFVSQHCTVDYREGICQSLEITLMYYPLSDISFIILPYLRAAVKWGQQTPLFLCVCVSHMFQTTTRAAASVPASPHSNNNTHRLCIVVYRTDSGGGHHRHLYTCKGQNGGQRRKS